MGKKFFHSLKGGHDHTLQYKKICLLCDFGKIKPNTNIKFTSLNFPPSIEASQNDGFCPNMPWSVGSEVNITGIF